MDIGNLVAGMARTRWVVRTFDFGLLALYALVLLVGEAVSGEPPVLWAWGLPVLFAGIAGFNARRLLARHDEVRSRARVDQVLQTLSSLDTDARAARLSRLKRRILIGGVSVAASVATLLLIPADYPRAVAWTWLWLFVSAFMTWAYCAGFLLVRRWRR